LGYVARLGEQERHGLLRRGDNIGHRSVNHHHPSSVALVTSTLSKPIPARPTTNQIARRFEGCGVHLRRRSNDQSVRATHRVNQLGGRKAQANVNLVAGLT